MLAMEKALIKRELLEHRSIIVVPAVIGLVMVLAEVTGHAAIGAFGKEVDIALLGATNIGVDERGAAISLMLTIFSFFFVVAMLILMTFYSLDALYAERKDKSILFWRSLPVTDAETVLSKLATALIVVPTVTLAFIAISHMLALIVTSFWVGVRGANAWHLIWEAVPLLDNWSATIVFVFALSIWVSPFIGWFLLVSAYTKRSPMLMAVLPLIIAPMLERIFLRSSFLSDAIYVRTARFPIYASLDIEGFFDEETLRNIGEGGLSMMGILDPVRFVTSPAMWLGIVVCGLLTTAAIYVRRYRDES